MNINKVLIMILALGLATSPGVISMASAATKLSKDPTDYASLHIIDHPLIKSKLTSLRDKKTSSQDYRRLFSEIAMLIGFEVTQNLPIKEIDIETPFTKTKGQKLKNNIVIIPILRAGLGMLNGLHKIIPEADVGYIGMFKDHLTKKAVEYFAKIPEVKDQIFIVIDPQLASGNSAIGAIDRLIKSGVPTDKILFMSLIVVPEGVVKFHSKYPSIPIYAAALDEVVNEEYPYISPGLGDIGDRLYGTKLGDKLYGNKQ